jgi:uncharacterized protein
MRTFEWGFDKAQSNYRKHGISFETATEVFDDPLAIETLDAANDEHDEERVLITGRTRGLLILTVVYTERGENIRIISARRATKSEHDDYYRQTTED